MRDQKGSVLLEGLIGITIFTIAMLGLIGLQGNIIANGTQSQIRLQASAFANSMSGMAQADTANISCYSYSGSVGACSKSSISDNITAWVEEIKATLPNASTYPPTMVLSGDNVLTITIQWKLKDDAVRNYVTTTRLGV